ncbi:MAG: hypothetical protein K0Q91_1623 [Fibrobacteria bacterium]|jgi:SAM-dependent methyltransferase|nr:hypothetical protein [Fibrobacteria bacterium]
MLFPALKDTVKRSRFLTNLSHSLRNVRMLNGTAEMDAFFADHQSRHAVLDPEAIRELSNSCYRLANFRMPSDPFSAAYRDRVLDLYHELSGRPEYSVEYEAAQFDPETEKFNFFPYNTQSLPLVGNQLITQGLTLRNISLPPGGSIVELGAGQGNTALNLALSGYKVTAVEVNQPSIDLMSYRAQVNGREIRFVRQDMMEFVATSPEQFDAVLFVASFHHCLDHAKLLQNLGRIVKKGGAIYFADEPILYAQSRFLPYPWGLRLDGLSLYFIRRHGWFELGYEYRYFKEALARAGWKLQTVHSGISGFSNFFIARRA